MNKLSRRREQDDEALEDAEDSKDKYNEEFYFKILNKNRYILLYDVISETSADIVVSKLRAMNALDPNEPIYIEINSPGGSVPDGMSIINAIENINAPVISIISGNACSMAALISIIADERWIYANSYWMQHSSSDVVGDYINYIKDRVKFLGDLEKRTEIIFKTKTKLNSMDIHKIRNGELWLNAEQALKKAVVDKIIYPIKKAFKKSK